MMASYTVSCRRSIAAQMPKEAREKMISVFAINMANVRWVWSAGWTVLTQSFSLDISSSRCQVSTRFCGVSYRDWQMPGLLIIEEAKHGRWTWNTVAGGVQTPQ